jgi:hypothetical protein
MHLVQRPPYIHPSTFHPMNNPSKISRFLDLVLPEAALPLGGVDPGAPGTDPAKSFWPLGYMIFHTGALVNAVGVPN